MNSQVVIALVTHHDGATETRIQNKAHILSTLESDVISVSFPVLLHNAN